MTSALAPTDRLATLPEGVPERTLGFGVAHWMMTTLRQPNGPHAGRPFVPTDGQIMFLLWWYALDEDGRWLYQHAVRRMAKGSGKAEILSAVLPTPSGWTTVGDIRPGDELFGADGSVIHCVQTHPVVTDHPTYRVTLSDGTSSVFAGEHLFTVDVFTGASKRTRKTLSVAEMADSGVTYDRALTTGRTKATKSGVARYALPSQPVLDLPDVDLPLDPYVLGMWLGDGDSDTPRITVSKSDAPHLITQLDTRGVEHGESTPTNTANRLRFGGKPGRGGNTRSGAKGQAMRTLRDLGVLGDKHIPALYLRAGVGQRLALLQGLMDSDGSITKTGGAEFSVTNERLARDTAELIRTLGMRVKVRESDASINGRVVGKRYRLAFTPHADRPVFTLPRKADRQRARTYSSASLTVTSIERVDPEPMRCITVSAHDGLYLTGETMWVTHNSPFAATLALAELCGPVRFNGWDSFDKRGNLAGKAVAMPLVQIAATAESQTENTMRMVRAFAPKGSKVATKHGLEPGKQQYNKAPEGTLRVLTSSSHAAEGAEASFTVADETEWWVPGNGGPTFHSTLLDNLTKSGSRMVETCNAWVPGVGSVAEQSWDGWVAQEEGTFPAAQRILYDARVAPPHTDLSDDESLTAALEWVYQDCWWQDIVPIKARIWSPKAAEDDSRRKYLNQPTASASAWVAPQEWSMMADPGHVVPDGADVVLFFDGSKSRDATALVGCEVATGHVFTLGVWEPNPAHDSDETVNAEEVDAAVDAAYSRYSVLAHFADVREWESFALTEWPERYRDDILLWAAPASRPPQPIAWDMRSHTIEFARAAEACHQEIVGGEFTHDGDSRTARHVGNAHRYPTRGMVSISKESPDSSRKIDAAVCVIGARMVRRMLLGSKEYQKRLRRSTGKGRVIVLS